jgi:hypothetical protein
MSTAFILLLLAVVALVLFLALPASQLAVLLRNGAPVGLMGGGVLLLFARQFAFGAMLIGVGMALGHRMRHLAPPTTRMGGGQQTSRVRSAALEMELDHESGEMEGVVLAGSFEGSRLADLDREELITLRREICDDGSSIALLDAYLDRRFARWREDAEADGDTGQARPASTGPMGEEEAYEVLGLAAGASREDITIAHRRLMKGLHPDGGGSTFLAAKVNEAKDVLLSAHG